VLYMVIVKICTNIAGHICACSVLGFPWRCTPSEQARVDICAPKVCFCGTFFSSGRKYSERSSTIAFHCGVCLVALVNFLFEALVENMVKKNRSRFPIVVLLTTLICSH
jgi:hypothetical protein